MGKMQLDKGKRGEREAAKMLTDMLGIQVRRSQQFKGGPNSPDLDGAPGLHLEVKRTEKLRLYPAVEQAESQAGNSCPIVLHRRNGKRWLAIIYLHDLVDVGQALSRIRSLRFQQEPDRFSVKSMPAPCGHILWEVHDNGRLISVDELVKVANDLQHGSEQEGV